MRKLELSGILLQARARIRKALGVPKHQAPSNDFYVCPFGNEEDTHRVDLDEESGHWYCMDCHAGYDESEKYHSRLDELWRVYHLENIKYEGGKPRPIRKNQKITDGELEEYFGSLEGEYIKVNTLKKMFGPTLDNPDGLIKINDTDSSTTVISSSFMRRLGKITGKRWRQEKAIGEKRENLVRFTETELPYTSKKKPSIEQKYRNLVTIEKIHGKIYKIEKRIMKTLDFNEYKPHHGDEFGNIDLLDNRNYHSLFVDKDTIDYVKGEIEEIEELENLLGKSELSIETDSDRLRKTIPLLEKRIHELKKEEEK